MAVHVLGPQRNAPATRGCNRPACMQATLRTRGQHRLPKQPSNTPDTVPHALAARRWHAEMGPCGLPIPRLLVVRRLVYLPRCQQSSTARLHSATEPTCGCQCRISSTTKRDVTQIRIRVSIVRLRSGSSMCLHSGTVDALVDTCKPPRRHTVTANYFGQRPGSSRHGWWGRTDESAGAKTVASRRTGL